MTAVLQDTDTDSAGPLCPGWLAVCTDLVPIGVYGRYGIALSVHNKLIRDTA